MNANKLHAEIVARFGYEEFLQNDLTSALGDSRGVTYGLQTLHSQHRAERRPLLRDDPARARGFGHRFAWRLTGGEKA